MKTIALMNPAGSSAKSTTAAALVAAAVAAGRRVLAVDLDPQANLTIWLGGARDTAGITQAVQAAVANDPAAWPGVDAAEVRADLGRQVRRAIQSTETGADLIAADARVRSLTKSWSDLRPEHTEELLAEVLAAVADDYDVAVLDCKGDLGVLSEAALQAADEVVGVAVPTIKSLEGVTLLRREATRAGVPLRAVIPSQVRPRNRGAAAADLVELMQEDWADEVTPPVRGAANLDAAYAAGQPIVVADPSSAVAQDLVAVYEDLVKRGVL